MEISIGKSKDTHVHFKPLSVPNLKKLGELVTCGLPYSLGTYKNEYRNKTNFLKADAIGLDFDGNYTLEQAMIDFAEYRHLIATTRNHQKEKHGVVADRFRVILFLSEPITDADTFKATWHSLAEKWPATDPTCKDCSRFWYSSSTTVSMKDGKLIAPVVRQVEEPCPVGDYNGPEVTAISPTERGRLSKFAEEFLVKGVQAGGRNNATLKAAKEFQQNLYPLEEALAIIVPALHENGTIAKDFPESEVITTIKSAYNTEARHEPRIKQRAFRLIQIGELYKAKAEVEWIVDGLLTVGGVSLLSSDPKAGKSTLVRQLMRDCLRAGSFLGRRCKQGSVHYYAIEEQLEVVNASFKRLGVTGTEPLFVHVGDPLGESSFEDFREILLETKPVLAVIDTLFDFLDVESENNYKEVKRELRRLRQVARESGTHIVLVHHNSKGQKDDRRRGNRAILGSTAISGGVDTIMVIELEGDSRLITTSGREINRWVRREIVFEKKDATYSLGPQEDEF